VLLDANFMLLDSLYSYIKHSYPSYLMCVGFEGFW